MKVADIIKAVRWCIDEETCNTSDLANTIDEKDDVYMDNIIKAKINQSLHWLSVTASSSSALSESVSTTASTETTSGMTIKTYDASRNIGVITMPSTIEMFNITRVRVGGWYKAVIPTEDTDDSALMMYDETACGTVDRPQAVIQRETPIKILVQPMPSESTDVAATVSYVGVPSNVTATDDDTDVDVPSKLQDAFVYHIAYLLLSAYNDGNATTMYNIALQQMGASTSS